MSAVEEIKQQNLLSFVESRGYKITKKGFSNFINCIFHNDNNPSMLINDKYFKCQSCGKGGSILDFDMQHGNKTFNESLKSLSVEFNITSTKPSLVSADSYMQKRGFPLDKIKGFYKLGKAYRKKSNNEYHSAPIVEFPIAENVSWGRIINVKDEVVFDKAHFNGSYSGIGWMPPNQNIEEDDIVFFTEGIFKAIALYLQNHKVISCMSSGNIPRKLIEEYQDKNITWIIALDNDKAGRNATKKLYDYLTSQSKKNNIKQQQCYVALPANAKEDWDDLYKRKKLTDTYLLNSFARGGFFISKTLKDSCFFHYLSNKRNDGVFSFYNKMYYYKASLIDEEGNQQILNHEQKLATCQPEKNRELNILKNMFLKGSSITEVSNCNIEFLHIDKNAQTKEILYVFALTRDNNTKAEIVYLTGRSLESNKSFNTALLSKSHGCRFFGSMPALDSLLDEWLTTRPIEVENMNYIGYNKCFDAYIFEDFAFHNGRKFYLNEADFFTFKNNEKELRIRTSFYDINYPFTDYDFKKNHHLNSLYEPKGWIEDFYAVYGNNGLYTLMFWTGSLFAVQIREKQKSYPIFEMIGTAGSGKSSLIRFLWKLLGKGKDYEGDDFSSFNPKAVRRKFNQVSNIPLVILEADRENNKNAFNAEELKKLFNGVSAGATGVKNNGNEINQQPFSSSILMEQNTFVNGDNAVIERLFNVYFDKANHNQDNFKKATQLESIPVEQLSNFMHEILLNANDYKDVYFKHYSKVANDLSGKIDKNNQRVLLCHAQVLTCFFILKKFFEDKFFTNQLYESLINDVAKKITSHNQRAKGDNAYIETFWDSFYYVNSKRRINHSTNDEHVAININEFVQQSAIHGQIRYDPSELKKQLKNSTYRKFLSSNTATRSPIQQKTIKCWIFEKSKEDIELEDKNKVEALNFKKRAIQENENHHPLIDEEDLQI